MGPFKIPSLLLECFCSGCVLVGCAGSFVSRETQLVALDPTATIASLQQLENPVQYFGRVGPFEVKRSELLGPLSYMGEKAQVEGAAVADGGTHPLVVILHGSNGESASHLEQAQQLASWGFHALSVEALSLSDWEKNGLWVSHVVREAKSNPRSFGLARAPNQVILIGHGFGAAAMAKAAGILQEGVDGLILLQPSLPISFDSHVLRAVKQPVIILSADPQIFRARGAEHFFAKVSSNVMELPIRGASYEDAQEPTSLKDRVGLMFREELSRRSVFNALMTAGTFSLASADDGAVEKLWRALQRKRMASRFVGARSRWRSGDGSVSREECLAKCAGLFQRSLGN